MQPMTEPCEPLVYAQTITPETARQYLELNTSNRSIRPMHVAALVRDMKAGRFMQNGDPIRFFDDGTLADGQHRLTALAKAGMTFPFVIVTGLSREAMQTIDGGMKRTHGDRLAITGAKNAKNISAALSVMAILATGTFRAKLTAPEMFAALALHQDVEDAAAQTKGTGLGLDSIMAAFLYIGHYTGHGALAADFASVIKTGMSKDQTDPAFVAREKIIRAKSGIARMHRDGLIAILCAAWAAKVDGKPVKRLIVGDFQKAPKIAGWGPKNMPIG